MNSSMRADRLDSLLNRVESSRPEMVRMDLNKVENVQNVTENEARELFGGVLRRAVALSGMSEKEARVALGTVTNPNADAIDQGQFSRWMAGKENPHMWRWYRVPRLRDALRSIEAIDAGLRVRTVIEDDRRQTA